MNPPSVYELTNPSNHSTSRITNIVQSIGWFPFGSTYLSSHEPLPLRLCETEIFKVSPTSRADSSRWPRVSRGQIRNHVERPRPRFARHGRAISYSWCADRS